MQKSPVEMTSKKVKNELAFFVWFHKRMCCLRNLVLLLVALEYLKNEKYDITYLVDVPNVLFEKNEIRNQVVLQKLASWTSAAFL